MKKKENDNVLNFILHAAQKIYAQCSNVEQIQYELMQENNTSKILLYRQIDAVYTQIRTCVMFGQERRALIYLLVLEKLQKNSSKNLT